MPLGPPSDPDRFDDFDACVDALSDDPDIDDPEAVCGAWENQTQGHEAMTDHDEPQYRAYHQPDPDAVTVRELDDEEDGLMAVRMPIASTGEVRNEGDEPLSRDELDGMARQINDGDVGVFLAHGRSFEISDARYGQTERLGSWADAEVVGGADRDTRDDEALLEATAVMADPEELPAATGRYRETLAILKSQAQLCIPMSSSIGWAEEEDAPGGNDLMEASIVGIPADPRTNSEAAASVGVLARSAIGAGADPEGFVEAVRDAVMGSDEGDHMSDDDTDEADEQSADTTDDEQDERQDAPEWAERMLEMQEQTVDTLGDVADAIRQDDEDDGEDDDDDDDDDGDEQSAETGEQGADDVADLRDALDTLREGGVDVDDLDIPDADGDQDATDDEAGASDSGDSYNKYGLKPE